MQGERLNMDVFSVLALLKKSKKHKTKNNNKKLFYGNRGTITAVKLQFCYIIRSSKKIKFQHNNLGLFNSIKNITSRFWTYTLKVSD